MPDTAVLASLREAQTPAPGAASESAPVFAVHPRSLRVGSLRLAALALALASASCWKRHVRAFVPPPPPPHIFVPPPQPQIPPSPAIDVASEAENPPEIASDIPVLPPPPAPPKRPPVVATPKPLPPPVLVEPTEPPTGPRLGQIFTADQLREYNRTLDESLRRVRTILAGAATRRLTSEQLRMVSQIRTFAMQAEMARQQDLVTAVSLARRADLLAQDLAGHLP